MARGFQSHGTWALATNSLSLVVGVRAGPLDGTDSRLEAEGQSVFQAMLWATEQNWINCNFVTDNASVFNLLRCGRSHHVQGNVWILDCTRLLADDRNWKISLARRETNTQVDAVAKKAASLEWSWTLSHAIPTCVGRY